MLRHHASASTNLSAYIALLAATSACDELGPEIDWPNPDTASVACSAADVDTPEFDRRVVALGLESPWEIAWGPDAKLWITERAGRRVIRVDPNSGERAVALELSEAYTEAPQDGLLGLALHPHLLKHAGPDYVYLAFTYDADDSEAIVKRTKLRRYTYDRATETLIEPVDLITGLPASNDHNSGRLVYGPDAKLYYTIGDQGKNQFDYKCLEIHAQSLPLQSQVDNEDWSEYQGKILRLELDGSIPEDNPVLAGVRSHIYTYGHRNAQGIVFGREGRLYADEQGPKSDDELNLIQAGQNYGWPYVAGYRDDKAYVYGNWSAAPDCEQLEFSDYVLPPTVPVQTESAFTGAFTEPLRTFYTVDNDFTFMDPACATDSQYICWPTIAPSSLDFYAARGGAGIPGWRDSLLVTSLKQGSVFRVVLNAAGDAAVGPEQRLFETANRYRDVAIAPDHRHFYVITDSGGETVAAEGGNTDALEHLGGILEFSYVAAGCEGGGINAGADR